MSNNSGLITTSFNTEGLSQSRKRLLSKPIIYPIFDEAKNYIDDEYWVTLLENASRGKFPARGIKFINSALVLKKSNRIFRSEFMEDKETTAEKFIGFISKHTGRYSDNQIVELSESKDIRRNVTFPNIVRNPRLRNLFISDYINENFSDISRKKKLILLSLIRYCFSKRVINASNSGIENGKLYINILNTTDDGNFYISDRNYFKSINNTINQARKRNVRNRDPLENHTMKKSFTSKRNALIKIYNLN